MFFCGKKYLPAILCSLFFRTELLNGSPIAWQGLAGGNVGDLHFLLRGDFYFDFGHRLRHVEAGVAPELMEAVDLSSCELKKVFG